jgi:hypothetical protein
MTYRRRHHQVWFAVTLLLALSAGCRRSNTVPGSTGEPQTADTSAATEGDTLAPPLAPRCPTDRPPETADELDDCIRNLQFDTEPEAGDQQRLLVVDQGGSPCPDNPKRTCRFGPLAKIEPLKNAHKFTKPQLQHGRIIARLSIESGQEGYPKLNLAPGHKTYWWVRRDEGTGGTSVYVSDSLVRDRPMISKPDSLKVDDRPEGTFKQALVRWLWVPDDETAKGTCGSASCK